MGQRIKEIHPAQQEKDGQNKGHADIDDIENLCCLAQPWHQLIHADTGQLRPHYVHLVLTAHGQHRHDEQQHTHTADPVSK